MPGRRASRRADTGVKVMRVVVVVLLLLPVRLFCRRLPLLLLRRLLLQLQLQLLVLDPGLGEEKGLRGVRTGVVVVVTAGASEQRKSPCRRVKMALAAKAKTRASARIGVVGERAGGGNGGRLVLLRRRRSRRRFSARFSKRSSDCLADWESGGSLYY